MMHGESELSHCGPGLWSGLCEGLRAPIYVGISKRNLETYPCHLLPQFLCVDLLSLVYLFY